jgi:hypothetical protein
LINIALERLIEGSFELPAFRTLNDMATTIRARVNEEIFATVLARLGPVRPRGAAGAAAGRDRRRVGQERVQPVEADRAAAVVVEFRRQLDHLSWVNDLGDARVWWTGAADEDRRFRGEASTADAAVLGDYAPAKRIALVFTAQAKARDDVGEMFCRRVAT